MNAEQLKASILQQAIEGKLVPQWDSEESVTKIDGELKDPPFVIPRNWKWTTLNAIGKWKAGGTPSRSVTEYYENGTIPWLKTGDLTDGKVSFVEEYITELGVENSSAHINPKGAVLIAMYGATIGKIGILEMDCATNQACCACVVKEEVVSNWYLFYYLLSQRKGFISLGAGGAQPNISRTKIINYPIPVPPLDEQKRIVAKIEELLPLVEAYGKSYDRLQELNAELPAKLKASILQEAIQGKLVPQLDSEEAVEQIGDAPEDVPFAIPEKWKWTSMSSVVDVRDGTHDTPKYVEKGIPFVTSKNLKLGVIDFSTVRYISQDDHKEFIKRSKVDEGDILMAMIGTIGNALIVPKGLPEFSIKNVALLKKKEDVEISFSYVLLVLKAFEQLMDKQSSGSVQKFVSLKYLRNMPFPVPPLKEQERIVNKVQELLKQVDALSSK